MEDHMSKIRKMKRLVQKKKWIIAVTVAVLVAGVGTGVFFMIRGNSPKVIAAGESVQSVTVEKGNITKTVIGTGNLESDTALNVYIPTGIDVIEVLVESGDYVEEGDVLATLDEASLTSALLTLQEEISSLDDDINDATDDSDTESLTTKVAGRVKKIYASEDEEVTDIMLEHGALVLLSVDGKMAVELENVSGVSKGDSVTVTLSDDTEKTGTVASLKGSTCIVTMTDNGPELEEKVTVSDSDGKQLGTGNVYIHEELAITGVAGSIYSISVSENESVSAGDTLLTLDDMPMSSEYQQLITERAELAERLQKLLVLSKTSSIQAEYAGTIQSVNVTANSETSESTSGNGNTSDANTSASATANAAATSAGAVLTNANMTSAQTVFRNTSTDSTEAIVTISEIKNLVANPVTGAAPQTQIAETTAYTGSLTWEPVCETFQGSTVYSAVVTLTARSGYRFGESMVPAQDGAAVTVTQIGGEAEGNSLAYKITFTETAAAETESETSTESETKQTEPETTSPNTQGNGSGNGNSGDSSGNGSSGQSNSGNTNASSSGGGMSSSGSGGASSSGGSTADSSTANTSSDDLAENSNYATAFTVSPKDKMLLSVNIDELDILTVAVRQEAEVTFDAIEGKTFSGTITKLSNSATSSGGTAKYEAVIELPNDESMRAGMNASATVTIENKENILLIPVNALQERGDRVFVYTEQDSESGELSGEVEVETGLSDGTSGNRQWTV